MKQLDEVKLSRMTQYFTDPERYAAILTAFRGEYEYEENVARNRTLAAKIRNLGYGFVFVDGYYVENLGKPNEIRVKEDSLVVSIKANGNSDFAKNIHMLGNEFNQEAVIVKDDKPLRLIFSDGNEMMLGEFNANKIAQNYTDLRKGRGTFVFEGERDELSWITRLAGLTK